MCGRYTITVTLEELLLRYLIDDYTGAPFHRPRYNVAPGQTVPAVLEHGGKRRIGELRWGLIPSWAKDEKIAFKTINARAETAAQKPAFRQPLERKRVLIPTDGFYEWKKNAAAKQPMRIVMKDESIFSLAGLYDTWISPDGGKISTCTILTVAPNGLMADIHDRMPAILRREDEGAWLDRANDNPRELLALLRPYPEAEMRAYPVGAAVGSVKNDSPELVREAKGAAGA